MISEPGIYPDIASADYFADPCPAPSLTQSIAKILLEQSPAHARLAHPRLAPPDVDDEGAEKYDAAKAIGNAAHAALIGRGRLIAEGSWDNWMTKDAKAFKAEALASGKIPILSKHLARASDMVKAASYQLDAAGHGTAFRKGRGEVMIAWREGDLWFRSLIDWMVDTTRLYDLKTSGLSCAPHVVIERPSTDGWDIQAAFHERGLDALDPDNAGRRKFFFVAQENEDPYALVPVEISEHDLTLGRAKIAHATQIWRRCIETGTWPLYPPATVISRPRAWTETRWMEREHEQNDRGRYERPSQPLDSLMGG